MYHSLVWYSVLIVLLLQESYIIGSTQWPDGEYALLKPKTGCPNNWKEKSWVFQDTKMKGSNDRSTILHIDGYVGQNYVVRSFCIKTKKVHDLSNWPQGQYCIYGNYGFSTGSISMTGEHDNNRDTVKYASSFVHIRKEVSQHGQKRHLEFYFQCYSSSNKKIPISLPITKPFYLLPYGSRDCQQVQWMVATSEWIKYKAENIINGTVPYKHKSTTDFKMFYCYYRSCNYTLTDNKGVFQSPGFPGKYPDGQLCSWKIMVPDDHTLHVRFTHFSLSENDTLRYHKRKNGSSTLWYTVPNFVKNPFTLSSNSNVLFIFRSDESNTSTGFKAEYRVFTQRATATPKPIETTTVATATSPATSSITLTTPRSDLIEETTTKKTSTTSKRQDIRTTTEPTKSNSTIITKARVSTIKSQQTKTHESLTPTNCTISDRAKKALTNSRDWNGKLVVIVIPLACFLVVVFLIVDIVYRCRSKRKNSTNRGNEARSVEQLPLVVNPTYDRGAILLNQPNDTTTPTTMMEVNENGTGMNQSRTDKPPDYEDIESWKPNKIPECNGGNVRGVTQGGSPSDTATTEETSNISENPFYESASTSPPLVEANKLYESIKIDQEKAK